MNTENANSGKLMFKEILRVITAFSKSLFIVIIVFVTSIVADDMRYNVKWEKNFGGKFNDEAGGLAVTKDGTFVLAGWTASFSYYRNEDVYILKIDGKGDKVWEQVYGGWKSDSAADIIQTEDGGYVVAGSGTPFGETTSDVYVLKLDGEGNVIWEKTYGTINEDHATSLSKTADDGFIVAGYTGSFGVGDDIYILRLDSLGNKVWEKTYGGDQQEEANAVGETPEGNYVIAGWTKSFNAKEEDGYIIKINKDGKILWQKTVGGVGWDTFTSLQMTNDGGYVAAGFTSSKGSGAWDIYIVKIDANGKMLWDKTYGGKKNDVAYSIRGTSDGGFIVSGYTESIGSEQDDAYVLKIDDKGNKMWDRVFGGSGLDIAYAAQETLDGDYILLGKTDPQSNGNADVLVIKFSPQ